MKRPYGFVWGLVLVFAAAPAVADEAPACQQDVGKFCWPPPKDDPKGILKCLRKHRSELAPACRDRLGGKEGEASAEEALSAQRDASAPSLEAPSAETPPPVVEVIPPAPKAKPSWSERHGMKGYQIPEGQPPVDPTRVVPQKPEVVKSRDGHTAPPVAAPEAKNPRTLTTQPYGSPKKLSEDGAVTARGRDSQKKAAGKAPLSSSSSSSDSSSNAGAATTAETVTNPTAAPQSASQRFCSFMEAHPDHAGLAVDDVGCGKKIHVCRKKFSKSNNPGLDEPSRYAVYVKCIYDSWDDFKPYRCGYNQAKQICQRIRSGKSNDYTPGAAATP